MIKSLKNIWFTPYLPDEHIKPLGRDKIKENYLKFYFKRWFLHPIKRRIAKYYLTILREYFGLTVIGITGSAGKTTVKNMTASILSLKGPAISSYKNIDPVYNIPTTILSCRTSTKYLVLEMGVEYPGEMDFYLWLAKPDIGVVTNIYPTHTEFFGDRGGVFREKKKLVEELDSDSFAVLNKKDDQLIKLKGRLKAATVWYGNASSVMASKVSFTEDFETAFILIFDRDKNKKEKITLPILGRHYVENALAAAGVSYALKVNLMSVKKGLESFTPPQHRMKVFNTVSGAIMVDDSYNNNPQAAIATLEAFVKMAPKKSKVVVFGDMLELGGLSEKYHRKLGRIISKKGVDVLVSIGEESKYTFNEFKKRSKSNDCYWFADQSEADKIVKKYLNDDYAILIKGSRSIGLDKLVSRIVS